MEDIKFPEHYGHEDEWKHFPCVYHVDNPRSWGLGGGVCCGCFPTKKCKWEKK